MTPEDLAIATWVATENIARFQERLKTSDNHIDRQMCKATLVVERERLASLTSEAKGLKFGGPYFSETAEELR
jgi:hypothetical protein